MQSLFSQHRKPSLEELNKLWDECLFVFDTNVLLNFYRYSNTTFKELEEALTFYKERIWIPHQVGKEFFDNRLSVINEQKRNYLDPAKSLKALKETFSNKKGHPFISSTVFDEFDTVVKKIEEEFSKQEKALADFVYQDLVVDMLFQLFNNRTGEPYKKEPLSKIYLEGKERYNLRIPPGFRDIKKPEPERYGDLIIWKQLIEKASSEKKPIIFISDDEKEDWLLINSGKTIGPLPELIKEFKSLTNQNFHIYQAFQFLKFTYSARKKEVDQPSIDEIKYIATIKTEKEASKLDYYSIDFTIQSSSENFKNLEEFITVIEDLGYNLTVNKVTPFVYHIGLNVPFKDLIRRFYNTILSILPQHHLTLIDFTSNDHDYLESLSKRKRIIDLF